MPRLVVVTFRLIDSAALIRSDGGDGAEGEFMSIDGTVPNGQFVAPRAPELHRAWWVL